MGPSWNIQDNGAGPAFLRHMQLADDKIIVPDTGMYYVYSFVTFRWDEPQNSKFLNQYLYRDTANHRNDRARMIFIDKNRRDRAGKWNTRPVSGREFWIWSHVTGYIYSGFGCFGSVRVLLNELCGSVQALNSSMRLRLVGLPYLS